MNPWEQENNGYCGECGMDMWNVGHKGYCSRGTKRLMLPNRDALAQAKTLARAWVREANALGKSPATGHAFGKADGLLQAADDLKKAVDPVSKASTREWVES
jgi:hypothetical protein